MNRDDLDHILRTWPEEPPSRRVRIVTALDGRQVLQQRIEMGVIQLELVGRPDGARPAGFDSWLDAFRTRLPHAGLDDGQLLDMLAEGRLYLIRAVALLAIDQIDAAAQDAAHARAVVALEHERRRGEQAHAALQLLAQAVLLRVRCEVVHGMRTQDGSRALAAIDQALLDIESFSMFDGALARGVFTGAEGLLRGLRSTLTPRLPSSQREELRSRLDAAIRAENFELAAILQKEMRQLGP